MDILIIPKVIYFLQDLVLKKEIKTFSKFLFNLEKVVFCFSSYASVTKKFIYVELKNIHAFLKIIQHYPNSHQLAYALTPLFELLLANLVIPEIVHVYDENSLSVFAAKYKDFFFFSKNRIITQVSGSLFFVPYRGRVLSGVREKKKKLLATRSWVIKMVVQGVVAKGRMTQLVLGENLYDPYNEWSREQHYEVHK